MDVYLNSPNIPYSWSSAWIGLGDPAPKEPGLGLPCGKISGDLSINKSRLEGEGYTDRPYDELDPEPDGPDELELVTVPCIALRATETNFQIPHAVRMIMTMIVTKAATTSFLVARFGRSSLTTRRSSSGGSASVLVECENSSNDSSE